MLAALEARHLGWVLGSDNFFERSGLDPRIGSQRLIYCGCFQRPSPPAPFRLQRVTYEDRSKTARHREVSRI